ncbi:hypothetical protein AVL48_04535 [Amycolatopsis regifaucium]|uniref:Uncharacterized protein n=2 Tax=Amycolatopsis regifaucium TaxID=546365 RepID=A0A154MFZ6_9PSEU|nr:hypothetical protein AVL48_04535 [Amycolatopsis regifaucium]OKA08875.1 hypothetical protein ATP06_0211000 [Amycolatopsis regifaucium]SFI90874.1 hypothetical protein SAMN04489731_11416 [Amycolatopsis regifaucium]
MNPSSEKDVRFQEPDGLRSKTGDTDVTPSKSHPDSELATSDRSGADAELRVRASQIARLTYKQYETIRDLSIEAGMAAEVAATTALLVADPQDAIAQLKRRRQEVIAPDVTATVLDLDVFTAALVRAPENLRMGGRRYEGDFAMPKYTATKDNKSLSFTLDTFEHAADAMDFYFAELAKTDHEVRETNTYGADIRQHGIRQGGILFPLKLKFSVTEPGLAGWETADCYGRVYFTQDAEGVTAAEVLEWLRNVPTDGRELSSHPLQKRRNALLAIAGKVLSGGAITEGEEIRLRRAVMPRTRMIVSVSVSTPMDEVRRRVVSLQHLDRPTPFSTVTDWQTRAEAVLAWLDEKGLFVHPPDVTSATVKRWLDAPAEAVAKGECHGDDIAMIAIASLLHSPDTKLDRQIGKALRTRGVIGVQRTNARSEVTAHVICRELRGGSSDSVRSSLERVLRWTALRDQEVDMRPISVLLKQAEDELQQEAEARSRGRKPVPGPATRQIAARAAYHLVCGPADKHPLLRRSSHGSGKGEGTESGQVLQKLAATLPGLQQLAQAIFDGRRGFPVRSVETGTAAEDRVDAPREGEVLSEEKLRKLALEKPGIADRTAAQQVADDSKELSELTDQVTAVVEKMGKRTDDDIATAALSYVEDRGWADPENTIPVLKKALERLGYWHEVYRVVNRQRRTDAPATGEA